MAREQTDEAQTAEAREGGERQARPHTETAQADRRFCDAVGIREAERHDGDTVNEMDNTLEHDDQAIVCALRGYIAEIRELDESSRELDRRRRDIYSEARNFGFSTDAIKRIARQRHDGEAKAEADDLVLYLDLLGNKQAPARFKAGEAFSTIVFGSCGFPSDFADALGDA